MGIRAGVVLAGLMGLLPFGGFAEWLFTVGILASLVVGLVVAEAVTGRSHRR